MIRKNQIMFRSRSSSSRPARQSIRTMQESINTTVSLLISLLDCDGTQKEKARLKVFIDELCQDARHTLDLSKHRKAQELIHFVLNDQEDPKTEERLIRQILSNTYQEPC